MDSEKNIETRFSETVVSDSDIQQLNKQKKIFNKKINEDIPLDNFILQYKDYLPTKFDHFKVYDSTRDGKWYNFTKTEHPLWVNENNLSNRFNRFVDERYILTDTTNGSQRIILGLTVLIIIILIIQFFIQEYQNEKNKIERKFSYDTLSILQYTIVALKSVSIITLLYYSIHNLMLRTTKPNYGINKSL